MGWQSGPGPARQPVIFLAGGVVFLARGSRRGSWPSGPSFFPNFRIIFFSLFYFIFLTDLANLPFLYLFFLNFFGFRRASPPAHPTRRARAGLYFLTPFLKTGQAGPDRFDIPTQNINIILLLHSKAASYLMQQIKKHHRRKRERKHLILIFFFAWLFITKSAIHTRIEELTLLTCRAYIKYFK